MNLFRYILISAFCLGVAYSAAGFQVTDAYTTMIETWHQQRLANLKSEEGWLNLAGLFQLRAGLNTFGSDATNDLVFPKGAARQGNLLVQAGTVIAIFDSGDTLQVFGASKEPVITAHGTLRWYIIQRGDRYYVRLRDLEHPKIADFQGIERFPVDSTWQLKAQLEPADSGFGIFVTDVIGTQSWQASPGAFVFTVAGERYRLYPTFAGDSLFFVFGDATNGERTYGAGRFLYAPLPDSNGYTTLDFNKAYNPPCAFSAFATCPLPIADNILPIAIPAGEQNYEHD
jgi:uncharacterized protein (DUF1684 family)